MIKHKESCLSINDKQPVIIEKGITASENSFKKYQFHLKFMLIFECNLRGVESCEVLTQKNINITFLAVFLIKLFVLMINLPNKLLLIEVKKMHMNLLKQFLKSINIAEKQKTNTLAKI